MDRTEEEIRNDVPDLESEVLKSTSKLIAPYFESLGTLKVLDLSRTNIQSLPPIISKLSLLLNLTLQECSMLTELPPEIGKLENLMTFDLEGTEIMYLPEEMGKLENLRCLRVSFCPYADEYIVFKGIENIIPRKLISKFRKLEELSICVNPNTKWWELEVRDAILGKLHFLSCLQSLKLYLPTAKELQCFLRHVPIYSYLSDFSLKIGHSEQLTSYLKTKVVDSFEKLEKCLKYENGEGSTDDIELLVRHAKALFVYRHWTIEKLSIFDISRLNYCLLAECNEMRTVVDADDFDSITYNGKDAFEYVKYLAIHSMKKLQSIWKGPTARNSFSCLQVLALHTCPDLTTVFTEDMLDKLDNLIVVIVEDCPKINSLVSRRSAHGYSRSFLPNLKKILLLDLPELVSLSSGVCIAPRLDTLLVFNCLKLEYLSHNELSKDVKEIKGETEWWDALKNKDEYSRAFVPLKRDGNLMNQLAEDTNSLKQFHNLQSSGGASMMSGSTSLSPVSQPLPAHFCSDETKKNLDWSMFMQYLKHRKPPVPLVECSSAHVIEFLKYLNKFGDIRIHVQSCVLFGHPNPDVTCFCPLSEAWGTLQAIARRLYVAYEENRLLEMKPFTSRDIESYLNEVRKSQENALGMTVMEKSDFSWRHEQSFYKKELPGAVTESQGFRSAGAVTESTKLIQPPQGTRAEASTKLHNLISMFDAALSHHTSSSILDEFRTILKVKVKSREHSSTIFTGASRRGFSSNLQVQEDEYATMSPMDISHLRSIARHASSTECMQRCVEIYIHERKTIMQTEFLQFNIEEWNTHEVKRFEWGVLESHIEIWIKSVKTSFGYLFESEKKLCEQIFQGLETNIEDICFEVIIRQYQIQVFNIIYTLSFSKPPPDKLFIILDLYDTVDHFLNDLCYFAKPRDPFQATVCTHLLSVLADKINSSLSIFEMVLLYDESSVIFVGPIDPLPKYVMSYLCQLCDHKHALMTLSLPEPPSVDEEDLSLYSEELKGQGMLSHHVIWIIMITIFNLEAKAKLYEDASAGHFFAMKNISYFLRNMEVHQDLMELVGDDYFGKDDSEIRSCKDQLPKVGG